MNKYMRIGLCHQGVHNVEEVSEETLTLKKKTLSIIQDEIN